MTRSAVILAAGRGTRLAGEFSDRPKGFLVLGDRPIIEESIDRLVDAGVRDIVIVTGHCREHYDALAERRNGLLRTVHNGRFADSGSLYSLCCAREAVTGAFLLLESDLVYEPRALDTLLGTDDADGILLSGPTGAGDEVYVQTRDGQLVAMSKDRGSLREDAVAGEFVGITKVSSALFDRVLHFADDAFRRSLRLDYETDGLVAAACGYPIPCPLVSDLVWAEIDDPAHLARARASVYPEVRRRIAT